MKRAVASKRISIDACSNQARVSVDIASEEGTTVRIPYWSLVKIPPTERTRGHLSRNCCGVAAKQNLREKRCGGRLVDYNLEIRTGTKPDRRFKTGSSHWLASRVTDFRVRS